MGMTDGVLNAMLVNEAGSIVAAARSAEVDHTVSAVLASMYDEYKVAARFVDPNASSTLQSLLFDCSEARVACTCLARCAEDSQILLCVSGDTSTHYGILWNKMELLKNALAPIAPIFVAGEGDGED